MWKKALILFHGLSTRRTLFLLPTDVSLWEVNSPAEQSPLKVSCLLVSRLLAGRPLLALMRHPLLQESCHYLQYQTYIHHHHHVVPPARISLTLYRHFSLSFIAFGRSSGLHPVSSQSCCMYARAGRPAFAWPYAGSIGVHHWWFRPCFSSSVLRVWFV